MHFTTQLANLIACIQKFMASLVSAAKYNVVLKSDTMKPFSFSFLRRLEADNDTKYFSVSTNRPTESFRRPLQFFLYDSDSCLLWCTSMRSANNNTYFLAQV